MQLVAGEKVDLSIAVKLLLIKSCFPFQFSSLFIEELLPVFPPTDESSFPPSLPVALLEILPETENIHKSEKVYGAWIEVY